MSSIIPAKDVAGLILKDIQDYNSDDNLVASDKVISEDGADF